MNSPPDPDRDSPDLRNLAAGSDGKPADPPNYTGPYTQAIREGKCPLCLGTGKLGPGILCTHTGQLHQPGDPCEMCYGSGQWPPPMDPPAPLAEMDGFSR